VRVGATVVSHSAQELRVDQLHRLLGLEQQAVGVVQEPLGDGDPSGHALGQKLTTRTALPHLDAAGEARGVLGALGTHVLDVRIEAELPKLPLGGVVVGPPDLVGATACRHHRGLELEAVVGGKLEIQQLDEKGVKGGEPPGPLGGGM